MALTFGTLLSSQRTNTHHHEPPNILVTRSRATSSHYTVPNTMSTRAARAVPRPSRERPRGAQRRRYLRVRPCPPTAVRHSRDYGAPAVDVNSRWSRPLATCSTRTVLRKPISGSELEVADSGLRARALVAFAVVPREGRHVTKGTTLLGRLWPAPPTTRGPRVVLVWGPLVVVGFVFGGVLLSHTLAGAVPSALEGLASGFGMGPGVSPPLWPP